MSRFTGARLKVLRSLQTDLPGLTRKTPSQRKNPAGQHGATRKGRTSTDYGIRLLEKQKVRFNYGVTEKQMRGYVRASSRAKGDSGKELLILLESRLDNVVFRAGFAPTLPAARQLVSHKHILVNGKNVNIPRFNVVAGDVISVKAASREVPLVKESTENPSLTIPNYLTVDTKDFSATMTQRPQADDVPLQVEVNLIVEYYSRVGV
ncbi:MAG: 30S ribosomal protein S4 [Gammaproteobacteria bacterium]